MKAEHGPTGEQPNETARQKSLITNTERTDGASSRRKNSSGTEIVTFRLLPEEKALIEAVARYSGKSTSAFVRDESLAQARRDITEAGPEKIADDWEAHERAKLAKEHAAYEKRAETLRKIYGGE